MATLPSPRPSASNSASSTGQAEIAESNGVFHGCDQKPDLADGLNDLDSTHYIERFKKYEADYTHRLIAKYFSGLFSSFCSDLDSTYYIERFKKYEADYTRRLIAKYFSGKTLSGGNIFDEQVTIDDEVIKPSRLPCFHSYANPIVGFEEQCSNGSTPGVETPPNISSGKYIMKNS